VKKTVVSLLVLVFLAAMIYPVAGAEKTTLTFWTYQQFHEAHLEKAVERWNKKNPDRPVELQTDVLPYDEMHNKLLISLQSGVGAPDLVDIEISKFPNYIRGRRPGLVALNSVVEPVLDKCVEARFSIYGKDGNYYGIDYHVGALVMYYNQEYLDQAGVDVDAIETWDDYVEAGKKVVAATGKPMATVEITEHWSLYPLMIQYGSDIFAEDGSIILDNPENVAILTFLKDMVHKDEVAVPAPGGFHHSEEYWAFMNGGGAASLMMPMWYMGRFVEYMPDLKGKILIRPCPAWEKGGIRSAGMGGTGTAVTVQSRNQDLAVEFLAEAKLSREGAIDTWSILGFDPIRWDVWDAPEMSAENEFTDYFGTEIFDILLEIKDEINAPIITEKFPLAVDLLKRNVSFKAIRELSLTPEEALKEAAEELRKS